MANAYVRMRHPDYDALRGMLDDVGRTVQRPRRTDGRRGDPVDHAARAAAAADAATGCCRRSDVDGPVAVVNAGWQERESDDAELVVARSAAARCNLRLFARWMDALAAPTPSTPRPSASTGWCSTSSSSSTCSGWTTRCRRRPRWPRAPTGTRTRWRWPSADALEAVRLLDATHLARVA